MYSRKLGILFIASIWSFVSQAQRRWDKVPFPQASLQRPQKAIQEAEYNYGSEHNPSPRIDALTWANPTGGLYLFGGVGLDENQNWGLFQDLWKYDPSAGRWILLKGERNQPKRVSSNFPSPRREAATWIDTKGNLWLYGGRQISDQQHLDDLWSYNLTSSEWEKVTGKGQFNEKPVRGTKNQENEQTSPGGRSSAMSWRDEKGNFYLFGGMGLETNTPGVPDYYNDLWVFNPNSKKWKWIAGPNQPNQKKGQSNPEVLPSPRAKAATWYNGKAQQLFLYGGIGYDSLSNQVGGLSDLWIFDLKSQSWRSSPNRFSLNEKALVASAVSEVPKNSPGFRIATITWQDVEGYCYLLGGQNSFSRDGIYMDQRIWRWNPKNQQWSLLHVSNAPEIIGFGCSFHDAQGNLYLFGGKEFDNTSLQTRPSNTLWKLN